MINQNSYSTAPAVSVVVPTYNVVDWIEETLVSAINQSCQTKSLEIVLVDDGSTDLTLDRAEGLLRRHSVRFEMIRTTNGGPSRAKNIGWRYATADWIQFLDGDDLLAPRKIELQLELARCLDPDVAVVYSDWDTLSWHDEGWERDQMVQSSKVGADALSDLLHQVIPPASALVRRSWLEKVCGFDERHWLIEDVDLLMRIAMHGGRFQHLPSGEPLFFYRQRTNGSLSRRSQWEFIEGCTRNAAMAEEYWRSKGELTPERARLVMDVYFHASRFYAPRDHGRFEAIVSRMECLGPSVVPRTPRHLTYASRLLGYRRAEDLAVLYRRIKTLLV